MKTRQGIEFKTFVSIYNGRHLITIIKKILVFEQNYKGICLQKLF